MAYEHVLLAAGWTLYCALHSVLAAGSVKRAFAKRFAGATAFYRLGYNLFAFLGLGILVWHTAYLPSPRLFGSGAFQQVIGAAIGIAGLALMAICIRKYFLNLSGLRSLWQEERAAAKPVLEITGVHRYVRHPLYVGTFLALWGAWMFIPTMAFLIVNLIVTAYTVYAALQWEEPKLVTLFGKDYEAYQQKVSAFIPKSKII